MPELPEVEVVRRGVQQWVAGRTIADVQVLHPRAVRRQGGGARELVERLRGQRVEAASRRGKYLWLPLASANDTDGADATCRAEALVAHLGMSGQLLVQPRDASDEEHLRVRISFDDDGTELRFVDQRTFGGLAVDDLVDDGAGGKVPVTVAHIARDLCDPLLDVDAVVRAVRGTPRGIKRVLLDQTVVSGVGNIYADEALWRAAVHYERPGNRMSPATVRSILDAAREVMTAALAQGGTSFDALYVNVNGQSGYFDRSLEAYGQDGRPCSRCATPIRRSAFMNRSSYWCPACQRAPRRTPATPGRPAAGR